MNRQFLFIKSATESIALPVDSFSHAEYTSDTTVSAYFDAKRSGKGATVKVVLTVSSGKSNDVISSLTSQVATGTAPVMKFDDVNDSFYSKNVTGVTSISTTEDPVSAVTGQGVEPGGTTGQVLAKASNDDYDTEWVDYNTLYITVRNVSGGTLLKGTPVHDNGTTSSTPDVIAADASSAAAMPATYVLNEDIANNSEGQAIIVGIIENVDTSSFSAGEVIYVANGGGFTNVKPTGTNLIQNLGVVIKSSASTGSGVVLGAGRSNDLPNIPDGQAWIGNASGVPTATTLADVATTGTATSLTDISSAGSGSIITTAERNKLNNIEDNADVTDAANVTSSLVAATAISAGDKTTIQSNLDVDPSGTDNSTDVSLDGAYDYITIAGQTITRNQVDYTTDISNTPTIPSALSDLTGTSDDITEGTTNLFLTSAEETKLGFISVTQAVDLDTMESDIATNNAKVSNVTTDLSTTTAASTVTVNSSDGTDATISGATTSVAGVMTSSDKTKLDGIETSADVTDSTNVTSSLVGATAISAGDKTTIQTNLGVDPSGTDNSTDVTLAGTYDYITIVGQTITRGQVDYTTDISNTPTIPSALSDLTGTSDNITEGTTNKFLTTAEETKLGFISVTQAVDLDTMESDIATNNAKVSNVTTDLTTTHAASTVTVNSSDGTDATINGATTSLAGVMTGADKTKLDGIETSADVTDATNVTSSLVAATAISAGDKTTIQTNIGVDPAGTDNSTDVSINANANDVLRMNAGQILGAEDAAADKLVFWDDSESKLTYATLGTNLTMTGATLDASGGGTITALNNQAADRLTTIGATTTELDGEANLTFDGTTLTVAGEMKAQQVYVNVRFTGTPSNGAFLDGARIGRGFFNTGSITAGSVYYLGSSAWALADADAASTGSGLLAVATDAGSAAEVLLEGAIKLSTNSGYSGASKGDVLYLSLTAGEVTNDISGHTTGDIVRVLGYVLDASNNYIYFNPDNTWLEI